MLLAVGALTAPAMASDAQGNNGTAYGRNVVNKPTCEALGAERSRDHGTASCVYTQEIDLGLLADTLRR